MRLGIYGKKVGMSQVFDETGAIHAVTVVDTTGCHITQVKTADKEGYAAIQIGIGERKPQNVVKAIAGHMKKAGVAPRMVFHEIRFDDNQDMTQFKAGQALQASMFEKGDIIDVIGVTKGRGFTGVMKRLNFHGKHATHGTSKYFRHGGSNGSNTFPGRVLKNKGMPGHYGDENVTIPNLKVLDVKGEENLILVKGAIPGPNGRLVCIRTTKRIAPAKRPQGRTVSA